MIRRVSYSGVIVGFEETNEGDLLVYVYGEIEGVENYFYLKLHSEEASRIMKLGIGQRVEGTGIEISRDPLILSREK